MKKWQNELKTKFKQLNLIENEEYLEIYFILLENIDKGGMRVPDIIKYTSLQRATVYRVIKEKMSGLVNRNPGQTVTYTAKNPLDFVLEKKKETKNDIQDLKQKLESLDELIDYIEEEITPKFEKGKEFSTTQLHDTFFINSLQSLELKVDECLHGNLKKRLLIKGPKALFQKREKLIKGAIKNINKNKDPVDRFNVSFIINELPFDSKQEIKLERSVVMQKDLFNITIVLDDFVFLFNFSPEPGPMMQVGSGLMVQDSKLADSYTNTLKYLWKMGLFETVPPSKIADLPDIIKQEKNLTATLSSLFKQKWRIVLQESEFTSKFFYFELLEPGNLFIPAIKEAGFNYTPASPKNIEKVQEMVYQNTKAHLEYELKIDSQQEDLAFEIIEFNHKIDEFDLDCLAIETKVTKMPDYIENLRKELHGTENQSYRYEPGLSLTFKYGEEAVISVWAVKKSNTLKITKELLITLHSK